MPKRRISEKSLDNLIKGNLAKGESIQEIKTDLVERGFDETLVSKWTNKYFFRNYLVQAMFIVFFLAILPAIFLTNPTIIGHVTAKQGIDNYGSLRILYPMWIAILMVAVYVFYEAKHNSK